MTRDAAANIQRAGVTAGLIPRDGGESVAEVARRMESRGWTILRLDQANPAMYGFDAPTPIVQDVKSGLIAAQGYSEPAGLRSARREVVNFYELDRRFPSIDVDAVWLGNGATELIQIALQAVISRGDELLLPSPCYPYWAFEATMLGGIVKYYSCDESNQWLPDVSDLASKVTAKTRVIVVINPNNPTGASYPESALEGIAEVARSCGATLMADEVLEKTVYAPAAHSHMAAAAGGAFCLTFSSLSKGYRAAGYRSGWMVASGRSNDSRAILEAIRILSESRLCSNVLGQYAIQVALSGTQTIERLTSPGGRLHEQRKVAFESLARIEGISCVMPNGGMHIFPKLDQEIYGRIDENSLCMDVLRREHICVEPGSTFISGSSSHLRLNFLPRVDVLGDAIDRIGRILAAYRQS